MRRIVFNAIEATNTFRLQDFTTINIDHTDMKNLSSFGDGI